MIEHGTCLSAQGRLVTGTWTNWVPILVCLDNLVTYMSLMPVYLGISVFLLYRSSKSPPSHACSPPSGSRDYSRSLATPESHCLTVLLQFCNELIALLHHILVLPVLAIRAVCLDNTLAADTINGAGDTATCNKLGKVTGFVCQ